MSTQGSAVASGTRSVAVAGDVVDSVIVTGDHARVELQLGPESGALLELLRKSQRPLKRLRPLPLADRPAPFADHVDRERETSQLLEQSDRAGSVNLHGPAGIGKTYVLHRAAQEPGAGSLPDGIAYLFAKNKTDGDLLQELFEAFYECLPPYQAPATEVRADLRERRGLVLVDSLELERDEAQAWLASAPGCRFLVASRERRLWEGASFTLGGLADADALSVLEAELGRPVAEDERAAAAEICRRTAGNPLLLRQVAARAREADSSLRPDEAPAPAELSTRERDLLAMLGAIPGASVGEERLAEAAGGDVAEPARRLERLRFVRSHSPRYSSEGDPDESGLTSEELERGGIALLRAFASWAERERQNFAALLAEADAIVGLVRWGMHHDRDREALRLARAADGAFAWARRFGAWGELVDAALHAARRTGDRDGEAWALHQGGTRAFALGDRAGAIASLKGALSIRRELGDHPGSRATQHNLKLVSRPAWYLRLVTHAPVTAIGIIVAVAALVLAGGGGAATWLLTHGHHHTTATLTVRPIGAGAGMVTGAGMRCRRLCTASLETRSQVTLTATTLTKRSAFRRWRGVTCRGGQRNRSCTFPFDADVTALAVFGLLPVVKYTVHVQVSGSGQVSGTVTCPGPCSRTLPAQGKVTLKASGGRFQSWSDAPCREEDTSTTCSFKLTKNVTAQAAFATPQKSHKLTLVVKGEGTIEGTCSDSCILKAGTHVNVAASASKGWVFRGWQDSPCTEPPGGLTCSFPLAADETVTAVFRAIPPGMHSIQVVLSGDGSVSGDVICPGPCMSTLPAGGDVTLTAVESGKLPFNHWTGVSCKHGQASKTCSFPLTKNMTATAVFGSNTYTVSVDLAGTGKGSVTGDVSCPGDCEQTLTANASVTLTASYADGYAFLQWKGDECDEQTNPTCSFSLASNVSLTAIFAPAVTLKFSSGTGGTVSSDPAGINCRSGGCSAPFALGSTVTLTAVADEGYVIAGWGGVCKPTGIGKGTSSGTCEVHMDGSEGASLKFID